MDKKNNSGWKKSLLIYWKVKGFSIFYLNIFSAILKPFKKREGFLSYSIYSLFKHK